MTTALKIPATMTADEFLLWSDGTATHYELVDGVLRAMTSPLENHGVVQAAIGRIVGNQLRRPCRIGSNVAIRIPGDDATVFEADAVITCSPPDPQRRAAHDPRVIFEIASPSTERYDVQEKLYRYRIIPSLAEVVFIHIGIRGAMHFTRDPQKPLDAWQALHTIGKGAVRLVSMPVVIELEELFRDINVETEASPAAVAADPTTSAPSTI